MVLLGFLLIIGGVLALLLGWVTGGDQSLIGIHVLARESFTAGAIAGAMVLLGYAILRSGTRRSLERRRESKRLGKLQEKLDRSEAERRRDGTAEGS